MQFLERKTIDTRTPLQKVRRTTLWRFLKLHGHDVSDNETADRLRRMIDDEGLGVPDPAAVDKMWFETQKKEESLEDMKRPDLVKLGASLGIEQPMKMKNPDLIKAIEDVQNAS